MTPEQQIATAPENWTQVDEYERLFRLNAVTLESVDWRINNIMRAITFWKYVKPDTIVPRLTGWGYAPDDGCGTSACFGGHLALNKMFGIKCNAFDGDVNFPEFDLKPHFGTPHEVDFVSSFTVSEWIFGPVVPNDDYKNLFDPTDEAEYENGESDHEIVMTRLAKQLEYLQDYRTNLPIE